LDKLRHDGVPALVPLRPAIAEYRAQLTAIDPDTLTRPEALAYWLNLYNAGALDAAAETWERGEASVFRLPGAFQRTWVTVAGEDLSLDGIEHGKVRHFGDPRIHGALVCGSASCPTLRSEPYRGPDLEAQLDDQLRAFLAGGGVRADRAESELQLSRVFLWYGGDFTRPDRMPNWIPARKRTLLAAVHPYLATELREWVDQTNPKVTFQQYDWSLACAVG
jgi:hypothetical protein